MTSLPFLTFVSEITALRREVTLRFFLHWKIEELIHQREHVFGISQQSLSSFASSHVEVYKPKRLAGFVEPVFFLISILNELYQGDGQERSCADIVAILDLLASHLLDGSCGLGNIRRRRLRCHEALHRIYLPADLDE